MAFQKFTKELCASVDALAGRFPFRLGATSYVIPADILPNVSVLSSLVDDVELVLFESEEFSNLPDADTVWEIAKIQRDSGLSFTVHLPLDISPGAAELSERRRCVTQCQKIVDLTRSLHPFGYVLHLPQAAGISPERWRGNCVESVERIVSSTGVSPELFCVEILSYPFEEAFPVVEELGLSVCFDIGHIVDNRFPLDRYYEQYWERTRVIHSHGVSSEKDHCSLTCFDPALLEQLLARLADSEKNRVLTIEVFGTQDFISSMKVMKGFNNRWQK